MQPNNNDFQSKWRIFHPQSTVWVQNPFDHDVDFNVADDNNVQYTYKMPAHKVSELPGGAVATLGVKAIVDELIQTNAKDVYSMWNADVRAKYEDEIILRIKEAAITKSFSSGGEVNLGVSDEEVEAPEDKVENISEQPVFPTKKVNKKSKAVPDFANIEGKQDVVIEE